MTENINTQSMLRVGTILHGTYRIDSYLSSGGFGNTYVVTNQAFDETFAVKEFFMRGITERDSNNTTVSVSNVDNKVHFEEQLDKFKKEAKRLRKLECDNIVRVYDLFEENGTAYYVMDYIDGENLHKRLERTGQPLTESEVFDILNQVLKALGEVHKNKIYHLDLKPANIMVDRQNRVKLIDFGASKQQSTRGGATTKTGVSYTNGYAPLEQIEQNYKKIGPWTDFYALGATLYKLLSNNPLPSSSEISEDYTEDKHLSLSLPDGVSSKMQKLIIWLMSQRISDRPQEVQEIYDFLNKYDKPNGEPNKPGSPSGEDASDVTVVTEGRNSVGNGKTSAKSKLKIQIGLIVALIVGGGLFMLYHHSAGTEYVADKSISLSLGECLYSGPINREGLPNGNGTAKFSDGRVYKGPFVNGVLEGDDAIMEQSNGDKFEGAFSDNHYLKGKYTDAHGNYYVGTFRPTKVKTLNF